MSISPELVSDSDQLIPPDSEDPADYAEEYVLNGIRRLEEHANGYDALRDASRDVFRSNFRGGMSPAAIDAYYERYGLKDEQVRDKSGRMRTAPRTTRTLARALAERKEESLDSILGESPGEVGIYEVDYVLALCDGRMHRKKMADGGVIDWAITRDELRENPAEWYIRHRRPDGSHQYSILLRNAEGHRLYRIEDDGSATVSTFTRLGPQAGSLINERADPGNPKGARERFRELLEWTLPTTRTLRERDETERAEHDANALKIMEACPEHAALLGVESTQQLDEFIDGEFTDRVERLRRAGTGWYPGIKSIHPLPRAR